MRLPHRLALLVPLTLFNPLTGCGDHAAPPATGANVPKLQAITFWNKTAAVATGDVAEASRAYVAQAPELTAPGDEWEIRATVPGRNGDQHVRLHQKHGGVPVWGGDVVVHVDGTRFSSVKGNLVTNLDSFDVTPSIAASAALATSQADYTAQLKHPSATGPQYKRESSELVIFPQKDRDARLAWHVVFYTEAGNGMGPGLWNYFVDAKDGKILFRYNNVQTLEQASGPGGNTKVPRTWNMQLDVEPDGTAFKMDTARLQTFDMKNGTTTGTIVTGPLDPIGDAAINDAHGFAEVTLNMLQEWMGFNSIDNNGFVIKSRVHYDTNFENAFWDGEQMTYGDGATTFFPLSGDVDVVAHEINHGFTTFHSNLIYANQSGGMNESFSDIAGTVAEFFAEGNSADFDIGRDIFKGNEALRFMCNPTQDGVSIDNFANYNDSLDVHFSSGIMNKAFCLAASRLSADGVPNVDTVRRVGTAFYTANASFWVESSTFQQGCQGVMDAAKQLNYTTDEQDVLRTAWKDVGVFCDGEVEPVICDETFETDSGEVASPNFPQDYPNNFTHTWCIKPTSGNAATLTFDTFNTEPGFDFVTVKDANGVAQTTSGTTPPTPVTSALIVIKFTSDSVVTASGWHATWSTGGTENQAPTVAITSPTSGQNVSGAVSIQATASDSDGTVSKVVFALPDGTTVEDTAAPFGAVWDSKTVADGTYAIVATAVDNLGVASQPASVDVNVKNAQNCLAGTFEAAGLPIAIPDNNSTGIASLVAVNGAGNVGSLQLSLTITHPWRGDLRVVLVAPDGAQFVVHDRTGGSADNLVLSNVDVTAFNGHVAAGLWQLRVTDNAGEDVGTLDRWALSIVGNCAPSGDWSGKAEPNLPLVDNGSACSTLTVAAGTGDASTAHLDVDGSHDFRSILRGTLTHNGVTVDAFPVGTFPTGAGTFSLGNAPIAGLAGDVTGDWTLCIIDTDAFGDTGTLTSWSVHD
ncbi:MAG TPA: M4 family metallopeptidase [Kofleriaceae bacterium]|nr:M4 family metallopeptidase [Kofleriaceae bacterium]